jgi:hypothetical protein
MAEPQIPFTSTQKSSPYEQTLRDAEDLYGLPPNLLLKVAQVESNFNPNAVSPKGAQGLMQIMPNYHPQAEPQDWKKSAYYSASFLRSLYDQFGNWDDAVKAYNTGPTNLSKGIVPKETVNYHQNVMAGANRWKINNPQAQAANTNRWKINNPATNPNEIQVPFDVKEAQAPITLGERAKNIGRSFMDFLRKPTTDVEGLVRKAVPEEKMGPIGEGLAGAAIGGGRLVDTLLTPQNAAVGAVAGAIGSQGLPGMVATLPFSGMMLKNAYNEFMKQAEAEGLPREEAANKVTAGLDALMAVLPFTHRVKGPMRGPSIMDSLKPGRSKPAAPVQEMPIPVPAIAKPVETAPVVAQEPLSQPAPIARPPVSAETSYTAKEPWYVARDRELAAKKAQEVVPEKPAPAVDPNDPLVGFDSYMRQTMPEETIGPKETPEELLRLIEETADVIPKAAGKPQFRSIPLETEAVNPYEFLAEYGGKINPDKTAKYGRLTEWKEGLPKSIYYQIFSKKSPYSADEIVNFAAQNDQPWQTEDDLIAAFRDWGKSKKRITVKEQQEMYEQERANWKEPFPEEPAPEEFFKFPKGQRPREPGEEGFADISPERIKKLRTMGPSTDLENLKTAGWMLPDGTIVSVENHYHALKKALGLTRMAKLKDASENGVIRVSKTPVAIFIEKTVDKASPEQLRVFATYKRNNPDKLVLWDDTYKQGEQTLNINRMDQAKGKLWGDEWEGLMRNLRGQEGFARIKNEDQKGFDFAPTSIPGQSNDQATLDLINKILQAPDSNVSKKELLGLTKRKKGEEAEAPLLKPKGLF